MGKVKNCILYIAKALGLFNLAKYITQSDLRIVCWHGFSEGDECLWAGGIMMHPQTLDKRMQYIVKNYNLMSLDAATEALKENKLPRNTLVITLDDGFMGTATLAHPIFAKYNAPYTLYLTTYYVNKNIQIVNLILNYALWKTKLSSVTLSVDSSRIEYSLNKKESKQELFEHMFIKIDSMQSISEKQVALHDFLTLLGLDASEILSRECLKLLTLDQLQFLASQNVDIQLHTHRHRFPDEDALLIKELEENARAINEITKKNAFHLCYPSGIYRLNALDVLQSVGIKSATTCIIGLNTSKDNPLLLKRFLDSENDSQIEFEANLTGFTSLAKKILGRN